MNYIEHIIRPERLLLSWLPSSGHRMNRIVAELVRTENNAVMRYFWGEKDFELAVNEGFGGYPYLPVENESYENILDVFTKRLPPRSRGDFSKYMESIRLRPDTKIDDFTLLGYSGAKLPDDDFSLIHPMDKAVIPFEFLMDVSGTRYNEVENLYERITIGDMVKFIPEPENEWDSEAIAVYYHDMRIGYVCRGILREFNGWLSGKLNISGIIEKKNGTSEKPRVHLFIKISE
jgi:hypothetical protein